MNTDVTSMDELTPGEISDPSTFVTDDLSSNGAVFIVPIDAPLPSELGSIDVPSGTLYDRIRALCVEDTGSFQFVPISGAELLHLDRAWRLLQVAKRVYVLFELPGARYEVMFTQAARQIGLRRVDWPAVAEQIASKATADQRTRDKEPWAATQDLTQAARRLPKVARNSGGTLEVPEAEADEDRL